VERGDPNVLQAKKTILSTGTHGVSAGRLGVTDAQSVRKAALGLLMLSLFACGLACAKDPEPTELSTGGSSGSLAVALHAIPRANLNTRRRFLGGQHPYFCDLNHTPY
jgi:hypothetical protein